MSSGLIFRHLEAVIATQLARAQVSVDILCPFVRSQVLCRLLQVIPRGVRIRLSMRWSLRDFLEGHSDPEVFVICRDRSVELFSHASLHLKLWCIDRRLVIATSANISERALGDRPGDNREVLVAPLVCSPQDLAGIDSIFDDSAPITEAMFVAAHAEVGMAATEPEPVIASLTRLTIEQLPSTRTPAAVWSDYERSLPNSDILRYGIPPGLDEQRLMLAMSRAFLGTPVIQALRQRLRQGSLYFGELKQWLREACCDGTPLTARDLTPTADALLNWLEGLGGGKFSVDRPHVSERLSYDTRVSGEVLLSLPGRRASQTSNPHD